MMSRFIPLLIKVPNLFIDDKTASGVLPLKSLAFESAPLSSSIFTLSGWFAATAAWIIVLLRVSSCTRRSSWSSRALNKLGRAADASMAPIPADISQKILFRGIWRPLLTLIGMSIFCTSFKEQGQDLWSYGRAQNGKLQGCVCWDRR